MFVLLLYLHHSLYAKYLKKIRTTANISYITSDVIAAVRCQSEGSSPVTRSPCESPKTFRENTAGGKHRPYTLLYTEQLF